MPTKIKAMETIPAPAPSRYAGVIIILRCLDCGKTINKPLRAAVKDDPHCCGQRMSFKGHAQPCACPSCQLKTEN